MWRRDVRAKYVQVIQQILPPVGKQRNTVVWVVSYHRIIVAPDHSRVRVARVRYQDSGITVVILIQIETGRDIVPRRRAHFPISLHPPYSFHFPFSFLLQLPSTSSLSARTFWEYVNVCANKQNGSNLRTQPDVRPSLYRANARFNISSLNEISKEAPI